MSNHNYRVGDPKADKMIEKLVEFCSTDGCDELLREILTTIVKLGLEHNDLGDYKLINTTLKELRHAMRVFVPYRNIHKVVIFGSARVKESDPNYQMACELAEALVRHGLMVVTGAGGGIMEAGIRGAGRKNRFGINIQLPFEQKASPYIIDDPKLMNFKYFFTRKLMFIKESNATVLFPGGFGTQDEGFENLTLFQTGKSRPRPIVLIELPGGNYWSSWIDFIRSHLLKNNYVFEQDLKLFHRSTSVEDAVDYIREFYRVYHSLRYVGKQTVLRFTKEIPPLLLERLNDEFQDLLTEGSIKISPPLGKEIDGNELLELPRLVLNFNKRSFGRLNEMIRLINRSCE